MKKFHILLALVALLLASCNAKKEIVYFQDVENAELINTLPTHTLRLMPGDKVSVIVTSSATPELAQTYNLATAMSKNGNSTSTNMQENFRYLIDENGEIDVLGIGRVKVSGLTRSEAASKIQEIFRSRGILRDAVCTVAAFNQFVTVLGEVTRPGRIEMTRDNMTILEALGAVGDLTIQGRRDRILVLRTEGTETKSYYVDIRSKNLLQSPVYHLRQNDVIVVEPNKIKIGQSTYNANTIRSLGTWLSLSSLAISIITLVRVFK